jgi:hypothetical protein
MSKMSCKTFAIQILDPPCVPRSTVCVALNVPMCGPIVWFAYIYAALSCSVHVSARGMLIEVASYEME